MPKRHKAITWTHADLLSIGIGSLGTHFIENLVKNKTFLNYYWKGHFKMPSVKCRSFCSDLSVLKIHRTIVGFVAGSHEWASPFERRTLHPTSGRAKLPVVWRHDGAGCVGNAAFLPSLQQCALPLGRRPPGTYLPADQGWGLLKLHSLISP